MKRYSPSGSAAARRDSSEKKMSQIEKKVSRFDLLCRETLQRLYGPLTRRTYSLVILEQSLLLGSLL